MSITPQELAEQIHLARKAKGWTLKECADHAGIGKTAMFDLEHGNPGVRLNTLLAVMDQLGLALQLATPKPPAPSSISDLPSPATQAQPPAPQAYSPDLPDHLL